MKDFRHKVVVVTGAGSGMGRAYALEFGRLGAHLALNDYDVEGLAETRRLLDTQQAGKVYAQAFDVADKALMQAFAAGVEAELGKAHVVINNAGVEGAAAPVWAMPDSALDRVMRINFHGVVNGTRAFLPQLLAQPEGALVNVSSIFGLVGTPNHADYCASKFAVRGYTEALMVELQHTPVSVHLVHPGGIATRIARSSASQKFSHKYLSTPPEDIVRRVIRGIQRGEPKIVYGKDSFKTWLGANLVPLKLLNRIIWRDMKDAIDLQHYPATDTRNHQQ